MKHDRLFKRLIEVFLAEFLLLIAPAAARRLRLGEPVFLDKEQCTDWPDGEWREVDLLARIPVKGSEESLLVHVEIEARARPGMGRRLWGYFMQIRQRHHLLVLPILINLRGGPAGVGLEILEEGFELLPTVVFRYRVLGLARCRAAEWLPRPEPVAWALAALMDPGSWSRAELKVECLRRIGQWDGTGFRKDLLVNWIESYVQLTGKDAAEYQRLLSLKNNKEVQEMELTWMEKLEAKGMAKGVAKGRSEGKAEGRVEGRAEERARLMGQMQQVVLRSIEERFGEIPEQVRSRVQAIRALEPLLKLAGRIPLVSSADELLSRRRLPKS